MAMRSMKRSKRSKRSKNEHSLENYEGSIKGQPFNDYFTKIFIINLRDKTARFEKTTKQFHKKGIKYTRFNAIDGRCKDLECKNKKKLLEKTHDVKIKMKSIPAASLTIGTIEILRQMIKNKWPRILICEDDIELNRNIISAFKRVLPELDKIDYDALYLGCGNLCGSRGLSENKTSQNKYLTSLSIVEKGGFDFFVKHKNERSRNLDLGSMKIQ